MFSVKSLGVTGLVFLLALLASSAECLEQPAENYFKGMATVKVVEGAVDLERSLQDNRFGQASLDALAEQFGVNGLQPRFHFNPDTASRAGAGDLSRIYRITFDESLDVGEVTRAFAANPLVEYAEPIPIMYEFDTPNDTYYDMMHHLTQVRAPQAWDIHHGEDGADVLIGICDSAVEWFHSDLVDNVYQNLGEDIDNDGHVIEYVDGAWVFDAGDVNGVDDDGNGYVDDFVGWNFKTDDGSAENNPTGTYINLHGTIVASMADGRTNNELGISSISWNAKFLPTKHGMNCLVWPPGVIYNGFDGVIYLAEMGCDIINCSWGGGGYSYANQEALNYARDLGAIIVAAAGNSASGSSQVYPACYPEVINVAALRVDDVKADYSNYGIGVDLCAPGGSYGGNRLFGAVPGDQYVYCSGTSFASPIVTGLFALLKSYHPDWTNEQLITQVLGTADDIDSVNPDLENQFGCGRINAYRALTETNVGIPQELRLELVGWKPINDSDGDHMLEPGDTASIGLVLRNYAPCVSSDNITLTLSVNDPDVTVTNGSSVVSIPADCSGIELDDLFSIQIDDEALPHTIQLSVSVSADIDITFGQSFSQAAYIAPSGVLVWDGGVNAPDSVHFSGEYILDYLQEHDIPATYATEYPASLMGFEAVFLCFGNYGEYGGEDFPFTNREASQVIEYLENGGNLYMEGGSALGYYQCDNMALLDLLGMTIFDSGLDRDGFCALVGQDGTIAEDLVFDKISQYPRYFVDRYEAAGSGQVALTALNYGDVAVQNEGDNGQKTFCSAYSLVGLRGPSNLGRREVLLAHILKFFGFPILQAAFALEYPNDYAPHAPVTVAGIDKSVSSSTITSWAWDFDSDGEVDSYLESPVCVFNDPGYQTLTLTVSDGTQSNTIVANNFIYLFNGDSSIDMTNSVRQTSNVTIQATDTPELEGAFTIEAWIYPTRYGMEFMETEPLSFIIVDKEAFVMWPLDQYQGQREHCLCVMTKHASGVYTTVTSSESIALDEWSHVAVTYDGQSELKVYVNGVEEDLLQSAQPSGPVIDNSEYNLVIGNTCTPDNSTLSTCFPGRLDEVRVWSDVRTGAEIQQNMQVGLTGNEDNLAGYWNMNEAIGDVVCDHSQNNGVGTLQEVEWSDGAIEPPVGNDGVEEAPRVTCLRQNFPNPFNPTTTISFSLATGADHVSLDVYNVRGQHVRTLVLGGLDAGEHSFVWRGDDDGGRAVSSGVYFYRLQTGDEVAVRKMLLMK